MTLPVGRVADRAATTHYLNADFDLTLRPRPIQHQRSALGQQTRELSVQALLGAEEGDCVLLRAEVPEEFLAYWVGRGLILPRILTHPQIDPESRFRPFGWNEETIPLNRAHRRPTEHPTLECVRRVNSRSFARELEGELSGREPDSVVVESRGELECFLTGERGSGEWIVKSEFGHAGLANRRIRSPSLSPSDRRFVDERLLEDDRLIVEPWRQRDRDWSVVFEVPHRAEALRIQETVYTRDGGLIGAWFEPSSARVDADREALIDSTERIGRKLSDAGYFGPVCVDAFRWQDGSSPRLRPLVDLNARLPMSDFAHRLWRRSTCDRYAYYRFFARRKLRIPATQDDLLASLGRDAYDRRRRRGILLVSPLSLALDGTRRRPTKLAVMLIAEHREGVLGLESRFRERFEV